MVYGIHKGGPVGSRILPNTRAIVLQQCGDWKWAGGMKARLLRAQTILSKRISCKCQRPVRLDHFWREEGFGPANGEHPLIHSNIV